MNNIVNDNDFKYYMQDIEKNYFGARYTYAELLDNEMVPFKFKTIITKYLSNEIDPKTSLESHLFYIDQASYDYRVYRQLKARVRVSQYKKREKQQNGGFKEKVYTIEQLAGIAPAKKEELGIIIRELIISKLSLFGFQI